MSGRLTRLPIRTAGAAMDTYRFVTFTLQQGVLCVKLKQSRLDESEIHQLGDELLKVAAGPDAKLALSLGPESPYCLYSVFLAKLVSIRNALLRQGGRMVLCYVGPHAYSTFEATQLHKEFTFVPDFAAAIAHFQESK